MREYGSDHVFVTADEAVKMIKKITEEYGNRNGFKINYSIHEGNAACPEGWIKITYRYNSSD